MKPPFRADQVGSLLRPGRAGRSTRAQWKARRARRRDAAPGRGRAPSARPCGEQESIGLQGITDGEFRRDWWHLDFLAQLDGVDTAGQPGPEVQVRRRSGAAADRHRHRPRSAAARPIMVEHFAFLKSVTTRTPKMTIPSPSMLHLRGGRAAISREAYPDLEAFWDDVAAAYRRRHRASGRRRLPLPAARRHQLRLPVRPEDPGQLPRQRRRPGHAAAPLCRHHQCRAAPAGRPT